MNRINTVNVTQHIFEEDECYLNLYLLGESVGGSNHKSLSLADNRRIHANNTGIILKITRTTEGDFMFEKVKEYP